VQPGKVSVTRMPTSIKKTVFRRLRNDRSDGASLMVHKRHKCQINHSHVRRTLLPTVGNQAFPVAASPCLLLTTTLTQPSIPLGSVND